MLPGSGMLPSRGVSGTGATLGGAGDEAELQLFNKPTQYKIVTLHSHALLPYKSVILCSVG